MKKTKTLSKKLKNSILKKKGTFAILFGIIANFASISTLLFNLNKYIAGGIVIFIATISAFLLYKFLQKVKQHRETEHKRKTYFNGYLHTHSTWHEYNKINNEIILRYDYTNFHDLLVKLNTKVNNLINFLKKTLQELYESSQVFYTFKRIIYKKEFFIVYNNISSIESNYIDIPFILIDEQNVRDPYSPPGNIIEKLDFDKNTIVGGQEKLDILHKSIFYESFKTKKIQICPEFNDIQQKLCNYRYKGGIVAPILLYGVPFALLCFGSTIPNLFDIRDRELIATYSDAISEYFRLILMYEHLIEAKTFLFYAENDENIKLLIEKINNTIENFEKNSDNDIV